MTYLQAGTSVTSATSTGLEAGTGAVSSSSEHSAAAEVSFDTSDTHAEYYRQPREFEGRYLRRWYHFPDNSLPAASVIAVEILALLVGFLMAGWLARYGVPVWVAPSVLALLGLVLFTRIKGASIVERLATAVMRKRTQRAATLPRIASESELPEGSTIAMLSDGELLATVLEIADGSEAVSIGAHRAQPLVPLDLMAESLSQYDIRLHSIDVVVASRTGSRAVWVTVRYEPARDFAAVERRGGDAQGAERALITATRRIVQRLNGSGLAVTPLDASAVETVWRELSALDMSAWTAQGDTVFDGTRSHTVGDIRRLDRASVANLAAHSTAVIRLLGHDRAGQPLWSAGLAVSASPGDSTAPALPPGACSSPAQSLSARAAILPGAAFQAHVFTVHTGSRRGLAQHSPRLDIATQLLGFAPNGAPVTVHLTGGEIAVLRLDTTAHTLLQVCFRAVEAGAHVSIATQRPAMWEPLVRHFADPGRISYADQLTVPGEHGRPLVTVDDAIPHPMRQHAVCSIAHGAIDTHYGPAPHRGKILDVEEREELVGAAVLSYAGQRIDIGLTRTDIEDRVFGTVWT